MGLVQFAADGTPAIPGNAASIVSPNFGHLPPMRHVRRIISPVSTARLFSASSSRCECINRPIGVAHECTSRFTGTYAM
ncbi:MAG: hypothetical protein OXQ89_19570, partial [Rhodospirillaceae bacterium]|nr:hypothetical protein [Rhodospirillaceae bacterium]